MSKIKQGIVRGVRTEDSIFGNGRVNKVVLVLERGTKKEVYVKREDLGEYTRNKNLNDLIGKPILYMETEVVKGFQLGDRKLIEKLITQNVVNELKEGKEMPFTITRFVQNRYQTGAYLEFNGILGFLSSVEYCGSEIRLEQFGFKHGDEISVILKEEQTENDFLPSLIFTVKEKQELPENKGYKQFRVGDIAPGEIIRIQEDNQTVSVLLAEGTDVLCSIPKGEEKPTLGKRTYVRIREVIEEFGQLRGVFVKYETNTPKMIPNDFINKLTNTLEQTQAKSKEEPKKEEPKKEEPKKEELTKEQLEIQKLEEQLREEFLEE